MNKEKAFEEMEEFLSGADEYDPIPPILPVKPNNKKNGKDKRWRRKKKPAQGPGGYPAASLRRHRPTPTEATDPNRVEKYERRRRWNIVPKPEEELFKKTGPSTAAVDPPRAPADPTEPKE